jgi:alpha-L-fucosidase
MKTITFMSLVALATVSGAAAQDAKPSASAGVATGAEGSFTPDWESLKRYECPEWFRDAKFGIWAHWGPQCVPMVGDWYAKNMYVPGARRDQYEYHVKTYGHPSKVGFKDIIPQWKAEKFDPERLMALYKAAGARYFVSMGVHHDNFDLWDSKHHRWNAVQMGPQRDIVGAWQEAAREQGLRFGVSEHLGASFTWFQTSHGSDKTGPLAGVPYDGADPKWEELYHWPAAPGDTAWYSTDTRWHQQWFARIKDLVDQYQPDLLYSDGAVPFDAVGRSLLAHYYNTNIAGHQGRLEAVYCLKDWTTRPGHGDYVEGIGVQDVERGGLSEIKPAPWQTDTSIGDWFYNKNWKAKDTGTMYRSPKWVIHTLVDVVSKNGNMLLNVIQRPDGSLDPEVEQLLAELAAWMQVNSPAIHDTRPWRTYGEGPASTEAGHFKEDFDFSAQDIRFTQSKAGKTVYAIALGWPSEGTLTIKSLATGKGPESILSVSLLGSAGEVKWTRTADGLTVTLPKEKPCEHAVVFRVTAG